MYGKTLMTGLVFMLVLSGISYAQMKKVQPSQTGTQSVESSESSFTQAVKGCKNRVRFQMGGNMADLLMGDVLDTINSISGETSVIEVFQPTPTTVQMFGNPRAIFLFQKCMAQAGYPLTTK